MPTRLWCVLIVSLAMATSLARAQAAPDPAVIHAPAGAIAPDVAVDADGVIHMVYGLKNDAFYIRSADNGKTFTPPVKVNVKGEVTTTMGERGPKIALGKNATLHVIYADKWVPGGKVFARHTRSLDGGKTWQDPKAVSSMPGIDGLTMTANAAGQVAVFWHTMLPVQKEIPQATWLYAAFSADDGATFGESRQIKITGLKELACSMCQMRARSTDDGKVFLVYRSAADNIRDFYVLSGKFAAWDFTPARVNQDNWELKTCPMCGPELTFDSAGRAWCAFMTRHKVYWAISDPGSTAFKLHVPTLANEQDEIYPSVVSDAKGAVLMVWQVGPMSTTGTATVKWATYSADGKPTGKSGTLGTTTSGTRPTAFVGKDGQFHIVTTAEK